MKILRLAMYANNNSHIKHVIKETGFKIDCVTSLFYLPEKTFQKKISQLIGNVGKMTFYCNHMTRLQQWWPIAYLRITSI